MFGMKCCRPLLAALGMSLALSNLAGFKAADAAETPLPRAALALATETAPKMDGVLDEPIWQRGESSTGFVVSGSGAKADAETSFRVAFDKTSVYFGIHLDEPAMNQIVASERKLDDKEILNDDVVEIFLQPDITTGTYYSFVVNPLSARRDAAVMDAHIDVNWSAVAAKQKDGWSVEVEVPFNTLGISEYGQVLARMRDGGQMRLNVCRVRQAGKTTAKKAERTAWSYLTAGFNEQKDFGYLVFTGYDIPLKRQFDEANAKIDVLRKLLPPARAAEMAGFAAPLVPDAKVQTEAAYRKNLRAVLAAEDKLNELLSKGIAPAPGTLTELLVTHLSPYDSVAKDRLAQVSFYANTAAKKEPAGLNFKQAVNEYEHDSFVLSSSTGIEGLYINATDLAGPEGQKIPAGKVKCSVIGYVNPTADRDFNYRLWNKIPAADIVEGIRHPLSLDSYESKQIWVTVHSLNAAPGEYKGNVNLTDIEGKVLRSVPIQVTVWPVTLPQKPALDYFMFTGVPFDGQTGEMWADFLVDHYVSWVYMDLPADVKVGNRAVEHQGREVKDIDLGFDITGQKVSIPGQKWNNFERLKILRSRNLKLIYDTGEGMMPPVLLPNFVKYLQKAGFDYKDFRYKISDEDQNPWSLPIFKAYRAADPKIQLTMIPAGSWDITPYAPYVDSYICSTSVTAWKEWLPYFQKEYREKGKPFSIYTNTGAWTNRALLSEVRADLRYIWEIGATEYSAWTANIYPPTGYTYPYSVPAEGLEGISMRDVRDLLPEQQSTSTFVYFRNEDGVIYPLSSKRLEAIRDGIKDWMYLRLLSDTLKKTQGVVPARLQAGAQKVLDDQVSIRPTNDAEFGQAKAAMAEQIILLENALKKTG